MTTVQIIYEGEPNALREAIAAIQRRSAMTEHLPECAVAAARPGTFTSCICERLRACEERTTAAAVQRVEALWSIDPSWDGTNWNNALHAATAVIRDAEGRP